ncbi:glycine--tRNA ligase [candidate division WWE3 bacterium CG06_land_8_20_14_3_00_42_16]|uniref:Glycine--tRNA ligase n=1 Tax=candidate division WWE3 bacterium CG06_land_8_20_14_3_00_42_16 TaxID=1975083 RepID=A0A2M7ALM3_UNCKA|nr:MAG: glycine--tRNA ligase [candidate division WWE3 bacterium CG06_land_8_20_14_3_00_42_16]
MSNSEVMEKIISLCKRRGFIFPGSEIYSGVGGIYDYGPLGVELKNNLKKEWWRNMVWEREEIVGLDSAIIMNRRVWEASGHVAAFTDPLVECRRCHQRFREDELPKLPIEKKEKMIDETKEKKSKQELLYIERAEVFCPNCNSPINLNIDEPRQFNLLMKTQLGVLEDEKNETFLRGETCQGIYVNFINILNSMRTKIPFGIAQIGKAFRNEITPGNFTFRMREFEQMEMQYFIKPEAKIAEKWFSFWKKERMDWYLSLGFSKEKLRFREHAPDERAHYAKAAFDIEYSAPFGWKEFEGIHNRGDWDLSRHSQFSGKDLTYFDEESHTKFTPWIIETSAGADRSTLFFLIDAYDEETVGKEKRVVLRLHPKIAPIKAAIFPLVKNVKLVKIAQKIAADLKSKWPIFYDESGSIGRRYRRQDEVGTPFGITVDFDSLEDKKVTVRNRDSLKQERVNVLEIKDYLENKIEAR